MHKKKFPPWMVRKVLYLEESESDSIVTWQHVGKNGHLGHAAAETSNT
jgi:hypothetical protein